MNKTLYVSDLDGTLLRSDQTISAFTIQAIDALRARGMIFSYATARSYPTAMKVTPDIAPEIPVIVKNGAQIIETGTGRRLYSVFFTAEEVQRVSGILQAHDLCPIVYHIESGSECNRFCPDRLSEDCRKFLREHEGNPLYRPCSFDSLTDGDVFYFRCIDAEAKLRPAYDALVHAGFRTLMFCDMYTGSWWLEIMPEQATKANAILQLKKLLGCERIVCFGDGSNDVTMFRIADECYAMANADDELKALATGVIGSNNEDGVARWLLENYR